MTAQAEAIEAYETYLPLAQVIHADAIMPYRLDASLALVNVRGAMPALLAKKDLLGEHLPKVNASLLLALPKIALATEYAALKADLVLPPESLMRDKLAQGWQLRGLLLSTAQALASAGLIRAAEVEAIEEGRGQRDMARDCLALADLFARHEAAIAGKHALEGAQINAAADVGSWLIERLRTMNAPRERAAVPPVEVENRDRLGTLLVQQYEVLEAVIHYFYGKRWEKEIPALQSRVVKREEKGEGAG